MRDEYLTEIKISRKGSDEPVIVYRLKVDRYDCKPFRFVYCKDLDFSRQHLWCCSPNYYSLGIASKRMLSRANRDLRDDSTLFISSVHYSQTSIIIAQLPDFYEVLPNGKVRQVR